MQRQAVWEVSVSRNQRKANKETSWEGKQEHSRSMTQYKGIYRSPNIFCLATSRADTATAKGKRGGGHVSQTILRVAYFS